jgi:predicted acetylornithine/succinylornithine family transaminase
MNALKKIVAREKQYLLQNYARPDDFVPVAGKGAVLTDVSGKRYLDFVNGIAVNSLGHNYPPLIKAASDHLRKFIHITNLYHYQIHTEVAELLVKNTCLDRVFFCNSGTEAIEAAIKFSRRHAIRTGGQKKIDIITFHNAFHGRTYGALSATPQEKYRKDFGPMLPGFVHVAYNSVDQIEKAIGPNTAAVIVELIQGEGGGDTAEPAFVRKLSDLCRANNALLIADEVQTGIGRTGTFMAHEHYGIRPDMVTLAKPLGGGLPLGAVLMTDAVAKHIGPGDHGTTFGGNPVACAAAKVVLTTILRKGFLKAVRKKGELLKKRVVEAGAGKITEVKGRGLWLCAVLNENVNAGEVINRARKNGLLLCKAGDNGVRFIPPLVVTEREIKEAAGIFRKSL